MKTSVVCSAILLVLTLQTCARNQQWGDAVSLWQDVTQKSPLKARGWVQLGMAYQQRGQYDAAIQAYARAVDAAVRNPDAVVMSQNLGAVALANMAAIYNGGGRFQESENVLVLAREKFPPHRDVMNNLVAMYLRTGRTVIALSVADEAIRDWPDVSVLHFNRGDVLAVEHRCVEADLEWRKARELDRTMRYPERKCEGA